MAVPARDRDTGPYRWILLGAGLLLLTGCAHRPLDWGWFTGQPVALHYNLDLTRSGRHEIGVTVQVSDPTVYRFRLAALRYPELDRLGVEDLAAHVGDREVAVTREGDLLEVHADQPYQISYRLRADYRHFMGRIWEGRFSHPVASSPLVLLFHGSLPVPTRLHSLTDQGRLEISLSVDARPDWELVSSFGPGFRGGKVDNPLKIAKFFLAAGNVATACGPVHDRRICAAVVGHTSFTADEALAFLQETIEFYWERFGPLHNRYIAALFLRMPTNYRRQVGRARTGSGGENLYDGLLCYGTEPDLLHSPTSLHEVIHFWNGTRPGAVLRREDRRGLYINEGFTRYLDQLGNLRLGRWSLDDWVGRFLVPLYNRLQTDAARAGTLEDLAEERIPTAFAYRKGALLAFKVDMAIRQATANRHSLWTVMGSWMEEYRRHPGTYQPEGFFRWVRRQTGVDLDSLFERCYRGGALPTIDQELTALGYRVEQVGPAGAIRAVREPRATEEFRRQFITDAIGEARSSSGGSP